jgi:hypothetical protein
MLEWTKIPSGRFLDVANSPLIGMKWSGAAKSDNIAALMLLIVLSHHANDKNSLANGLWGDTQMSYDKLAELLGISRTKISNGIRVLESLALIKVSTNTRPNIFTIVGLADGERWGKLPAKGLYDKSLSKIKVFESFKLRSKVELNALKIYLVIVAFRDSQIGYTKLGYEKITQYADVQRNDIKPALSYLIANDFLQVDSESTDLNQFSTANVYWLRHIEPHKHKGTIGRKDTTQNTEVVTFL